MTLTTPPVPHWILGGAPPRPHPQLISGNSMLGSTLVQPQPLGPLSGWDQGGLSVGGALASEEEFFTVHAGLKFPVLLAQFLWFCFQACFTAPRLEKGSVLRFLKGLALTMCSTVRQAREQRRPREVTIWYIDVPNPGDQTLEVH